MTFSTMLCLAEFLQVPHPYFATLSRQYALFFFSSLMDWEPHDRHWIRLRGPWEAVLIDDEGTESPAGRITLPARWVDFCHAHTGTARFSRRFQQPTNLDSDERVVVTLSNVETDLTCSLNGRSLGPLPSPHGDPQCWPTESCLSYDVTEDLQVSNVLTVQLQLPSAHDAPTIGLHASVLLEIIAVEDSLTEPD